MDNSSNMLNELIRTIGVMSELWMIAYNSFRNMKLSDEEAMKHTKEFMPVIMHEAMSSGKEKPDDQT